MLGKRLICKPWDLIGTSAPRTNKPTKRLTTRCSRLDRLQADPLSLLDPGGLELCCPLVTHVRKHLVEDFLIYRGPARNF